MRRTLLLVLLTLPLPAVAQDFPPVAMPEAAEQESDATELTGGARFPGVSKWSLA